MRRARRAVGLLATVLAAGSVAFATPSAATPGPSSAPEYWFDTWQVPALWDSGARGQGITIAEIDTGVSVVPQLSGRVLRGTDLSTAGGDGQVDRDDDAFGHGTAMASIMVGRAGPFDITGLAPDAKVLPIAVPLNGTTESGQPDRLGDAIRYAADHGAKIINMSLGGKRSADTDQSACPDDEQEAVYYALSKGLVITAAVGNTGRTTNSVEDPSVCLGVVAVGASDRAGKAASFSTEQPYVTLLAPGVDVPSLSKQSGVAYTGDGTSQATALTSAALALVWSKYPTLTNTQLVARVLATLDGRRATSTSSSGYGVLDAGQAVRADVPTTAANPVATAVAPFLARYRSSTAPVSSPPKPAAPTASLPGGYAVGSAPGAGTSRVVLGAVLAGVGVLVLLGVGFAGVRRRRRPVPVAAVPYDLPGHERPHPPTPDESVFPPSAD